MIRRLFQYLHADWDQFRNLLRVSLITEIRQQRSSSQKKRRIPVFIRSLLFYLIMGFSLGASMVMRVPPPLYTLFCYSYFMMMTAMAVILECSHVLMIPEDLDILNHRPVSSATFFMARVTHLMIFILILSTTLCIGPTLISFFLPEAPDSFPLAFGSVAWLAVFLTAALMMLFYTVLIKLIRFEKLRSVVMGVQLLFTLVLIFLYQLIVRLGPGTDTISFHLSGTWLRWLPPGWFTAIIETLYSNESSRRLYLPILSVLLSIAFLLIAFSRLSPGYLQDVALQESSVPSNKKQKVKSATSSKFIFKPSFFRYSETRAGFFLAIQLLRRDRAVKMTMLPILAIPLVVLIWAIIDKAITDPFLFPVYDYSGNSMQMLPFFISFVIFMTLKGSAFTTDWEARWIFQSAPVMYPIRFWKGVRNGLFMFIICPFYLLLLILFSTQFSILHAVEHTFYLFLLGIVFLSFLSLFHKDWPFSKKRERGERAGGLVFILFFLPVLVVSILTQLFAYKNQFNWLITISGLCMLWILIEQLGNRRRYWTIILNEIE